MTVTSAQQSASIYQTNAVSKTSSTAQTASTNSTGEVDRLEQMQEKYKDIYTPIPETYSKADEDLQTQKIYEAYPKYIDFRDFLKIVDSFIEGPRIQLGQELTDEQKIKQKEDYDQAYEKAYSLFGGEEAFAQMQKGAMEIKEEYPVNNWGKNSKVTNETELARFKNAAVYEELEKGKNIDEAKIYAHNLIASFMDTSYSEKSFIETLVKAGIADPDALNKETVQTKVDLDSPYRSSMDLRKYGIETSWESYNIYESQAAMLSEIENKIGQYQFMINNEALIKDEYSKLDPSYQDSANNSGYKKWIEEKLMPLMKDGLNILENYKIYDSVDVKA